MQKVTEYLRSNQARFIEDLCDYVRFPSVSAQPEHRKDLKACAEWLVKHCKGIGLETRLCTTEGNPIVVAKTPRKKGVRRPHYMVYGHYDVQPPEPFDLWKTPPFEPTIRGSSMFGRGASDNKGQNLAHLTAAEAYIKTGTELPCDLTFVIEGEEEVGSKSLAAFLVKNQAELTCDAVVISDTGIPAKQLPALTYALRGIAAFEIIIHGPSRDLHSGIFGGSVDNPAMALAQILAKLRDKNGRITIPGFYDDVAPLSTYERKQMARLPGSEKEFARFLGVPKLFGEKGFTANEQRMARPTFEINGLTSGYQGEGSKTIVPSWARVKITMRLVPNQNPGKIIKSFRSYLTKLCPPTVRMEIKSGHGAEPYIVSPTSSEAQAALRALKSAFGKEPVLMREGGSIPIVNQFKKYLRADTLLLGLALPDDNAHSPNEKFDLELFEKGQLMSAHLWQELPKK
ncbi:dipeptidase [Pedosphaera parvula]|uniref:Peptidase M20 n=1 Tax=Pedosphaera parvula (strain Ellin514) TaxID=320771 RepID=B9XSF0_PEDPL|nr:dipeptidase [Pedosphaera parvula]EEF57215.1 peptidase M20 [Pedosphaera parvula Ellin514]